MAMNMNNGLSVVEPIVEQVALTIPDLREVLETARARYLGQFDSVVLRLEGEILNLAGVLQCYPLGKNASAERDRPRSSMLSTRGENASAERDLPRSSMLFTGEKCFCRDGPS